MPYRMKGHANGWRSRINTSALYGLEKPSDLQEAFLVGSQHRTGDPAYDQIHYPPNKWPDEVPGLREAADRCTAAMSRAAENVLSVLADILGLPVDFFTRSTDRATWTLSINWYPSLREVSAVQEGQQRVAATPTSAR